MISSKMLKVAALIPLGVACVVLPIRALSGNAGAGDRPFVYLIPVLTMVMLIFIGWIWPLGGAILLGLAAVVSYVLLSNPQAFSGSMSLALMISAPALFASLLLFAEVWLAKRERDQLAATLARLRREHARPRRRQEAVNAATTTPTPAPNAELQTAPEPEGEPERDPEHLPG